MQAFDDLLLMKRGGMIIYHGRLGRHSHRLIEYFEAIPGVPSLPEGLNPATWMLQISTPGMEATIGADFADIYRNSPLFQCAPACSCLLTKLSGSYFDAHYAERHAQRYVYIYITITLCMALSIMHIYIHSHMSCTQ